MKRWLLRLLVATVGALSSYMGLSVVLFVLSLHRASLSHQAHAARPLPTLRAEDRILIIAPHPDDEVLGCGGLIATAAQQGIPVRVVYLTCGDGFAAAAALVARKAPQPRECLVLGQLRQQEARHALQQLGLSPDAAVFLGYPDRGLLPMLLAPGKAYRAPATQAHAVPYATALTPNAPYTPQALVADLRRVLAEFQPTRVFTTHPLDDHEDHMAAALLTREAIAQALAAGELRCAPALYYYLVHRGDWPLPQGYHPQHALKPPVGLESPAWYTLPLDEPIRARKLRALQAHKSQYTLMTRFLSSFIRANELFAPDPLRESLQPFNDNPVVHLQPRADLAYVAAEGGRAGVRVRVETHKPFRSPYQLEITLLTVDSAGNWNATRWRYPNRRLWVRREEAVLKLWLPHRAIQSAKRAYLMVSTKLYGAELDRTGFLQVSLHAAFAESDAQPRRSTPRYAP
ncbi:MAG: PIG-L family deacetylase [Fimbriimonadales bacterium]|nr:PIG-L family deacetylase [Fimbriimonadales bacterium]MDW8051148.1 PIG-L family deacetylase [Armatimonadota bacterium]